MPAVPPMIVWPVEELNFACWALGLSEGCLPSCHNSQFSHRLRLPDVRPLESIGICNRKRLAYPHISHRRNILSREGGFRESAHTFYMDASSSRMNQHWNPSLPMIRPLTRRTWQSSPSRLASSSCVNQLFSWCSSTKPNRRRRPKISWSRSNSGGGNGCPSLSS